MSATAAAVLQVVIDPVFMVGTNKQVGSAVICTWLGWYVLAANLGSTPASNTYQVLLC
jgi:hypothetical protein